MDRVKSQRQDAAHKQADQRQDQTRRDAQQRTQVTNNLNANRLAPPRSQSMRAMERQLARMSQDRSSARTGARGSERIGSTTSVGSTAQIATPSAPQQGASALEQSERPQVTERPEVRDQKADALVAADFAALNAANPSPAMAAPALVLSNADVVQFSSGSGGQNGNNPAALLQRLSQEISVGGRWIDVLWQFILSNQKRVLDLDRLGIEPSERVDLQVDLIREIAATYGKLGLLTRLPDSLNKERETKAIDDIRTFSLVYVARKMMDLAAEEEISNEEEKQLPEFPRSVIAPYEGIPTIEIDALALIAQL
jgi:hypothetical protein